jgi:hypothetical protein
MPGKKHSMLKVLSDAASKSLEPPTYGLEVLSEVSENKVVVPVICQVFNAKEKPNGKRMLHVRFTTGITGHIDESYVEKHGLLTPDTIYTVRSIVDVVGADYVLVYWKGFAEPSHEPRSFLTSVKN